MVKKRQKRGRVKEIKRFAENYDLGSTIVFVRCYLVIATGRYEVSLQAHGETAMMDVPGVDEGLLPRRISEGVLAFAESIKLRSPSRG